MGSDSFAQSLNINHLQEQLPFPSTFPNNNILIHDFTGIFLAQIHPFADKATDSAVHSCHGMVLPWWAVEEICKFTVQLLGVGGIWSCCLYFSGLTIPFQHCPSVWDPCNMLLGSFILLRIPLKNRMGNGVNRSEKNFAKLPCHARPCHNIQHLSWAIFLSLCLQYQLLLILAAVICILSKEGPLNPTEPTSELTAKDFVVHLTGASTSLPYLPHFPTSVVALYPSEIQSPFNSSV